MQAIWSDRQECLSDQRTLPYSLNLRRVKFSEFDTGSKFTTEVANATESVEKCLFSREKGHENGTKNYGGGKTQRIRAP